MSQALKIELSLPDAKALLALLSSTDTFPDVVDELEAAVGYLNALPFASTRERGTKK